MIFPVEKAKLKHNLWYCNNYIEYGRQRQNHTYPSLAKPRHGELTTVMKSSTQWSIYEEKMKQRANGGLEINVTWLWQDGKRASCSGQRRRNRFGPKGRPPKERAASDAAPPLSDPTNPSCQKPYPHYTLLQLQLPLICQSINQPINNYANDNLGGITSSLFLILRINPTKANALIPKKTPKLPCTQKKQREIEEGFALRAFGRKIEFLSCVPCVRCVRVKLIFKSINGCVLRFAFSTSDFWCPFEV